MRTLTEPIFDVLFWGHVGYEPNHLTHITWEGMVSWEVKDYFRGALNSREINGIWRSIDSRCSSWSHYFAQIDSGEMQIDSDISYLHRKNSLVPAFNI